MILRIKRGPSPPWGRPRGLALQSHLPAMRNIRPKVRRQGAEYVLHGSNRTEIQPAGWILSGFPADLSLAAHPYP